MLEFTVFYLYGFVSGVWTLSPWPLVRGLVYSAAVWYKVISSYAVSEMYGFLCWGGIGVKQVKAASMSRLAD